jgi:hypothetical protein
MIYIPGVGGVCVANAENQGSELSYPQGRSAPASRVWRKNFKKEYYPLAGSRSCTNLPIRQRKAAADEAR